jgi:hypothetical protein
VWVIGCPGELLPLTPEKASTPTSGYYAAAFREFFPGVKVPDRVGVSCCAQFAVSRTKVRERPKKDYERYRRWLIDTNLTDYESGRVMEYTWHQIFGQDPVHCPDARSCYCDTFGYCDDGMECEEKECKGMYTLPPFSTIPKGWPKIGWSGEEREV